MAPAETVMAVYSPDGVRGQGTGKPDETERLMSGLERGRRKSTEPQLADVLLYRTPGSVRAKAEWLSYSTATFRERQRALECSGKGHRSLPTEGMMEASHLGSRRVQTETQWLFTFWQSECCRRSILVSVAATSSSW